MSDPATTQTNVIPPTPKPWYLSKTLWVNAIAVGASFAAGHFNLQIDIQDQVAILGVINLALRAITKQPVSWSTSANT